MSEPLSPQERALLARLPEKNGPAVDDGILHAWRAGRLPAEEADEVAAAIAADPQSRALLRAIAEQSPRAEDRAWMAGMHATRRARNARRVAWGLGLAAAAAAALFMMRADVRPDYVAIAPAGGIAPTRGDDTPVSQVFAPNGRLRYLVRPAADATPAATCAAFVAPAGAPARAIDPRFVTLAPSGVCRLEADVRALMQQPGDYTITLIVGGTPDGSARAPWPGWRTDDARILSAPVTLQIEEKP